MANRVRKTWLGSVVASALALGASMLALGAGCASSPTLSGDASSASAAEENAPLGGSALLQRKRELRRAYETLSVFQNSYERLRGRREQRNVEILGEYLEAYLGMELDPLLRSEWQSRHPELMGLDASLRLAKADLLVRMKERSRADAVLDETARRFRGSEGMLVEYPAGEQNRLDHALERLRGKRWWTL